MPVDEATIPILDPAFTKSDVVFDAVSVWDGAFFRLDDHLARFHDSCDTIRVTPPVSDDEIRQIMAQCVDRAGFANSVIYILCTRGRYAGGIAFGDPRTAENEFIAYAVPYYWIVPKDRVETGAHLWIAETRRAPDAAINQRAKNFNRMDLTRAQFEALDAGADAPVLLSTDGFITEGPGFNVWIVRDGQVVTPGDNLLEGITRRTVFDLCAMAGLEAATADLTAEDLRGANEVFLSSTGGGVIPVTRVSDQAVANGAPGLTTGRLSDLYWRKRAEGWLTTPVADLLQPEVAEAASAE
jgi:branched-chain amino acid aminotransferase